ncbi:phosphatidylglycerophosphatase A [Simiduia agarivorans]|uniref:Phosphatidylglycerophosphatase A n=1 Tax=Simiduia agarivorans (strain DSM 21679 / JCM 13881 / BCRC 17597 / SA1) TaxID=1117647 RepID=K4KJK2_SIMAS|nr:phosphatidylglycerophosphatase A [Simiduia agarivorans]AFU99151.1 phosphatidylglycerophosphatase [Simiduia agarivorans SA1 = DSM 21679]
MRSLPGWRALLADPRLFCALGFGSGLAPKAPGTFGTLMALPLFLILQPLPAWVYAGVVLAAFFLGIYLCGYAGRWLGVSDHGAIVWDEFVGLWIALFLVPQGWAWLVYGFLLFRLFDVLKPWPIDWADKQVKGGLGVMLDDVLAGVMAWFVVQATAQVLA